MSSIDGPKVTTHSDGAAATANLKDGPTAVEPKANALPTDFYSQFLTEQSKSRLPSPIRELLPLELRPGIISLLAGKPNATTFPITSISFNARTPVGVDGYQDTEVKIEGTRMEDALQYGPTAGDAKLISWLSTLQQLAHKRESGADWSIAVGTGSQDLLYKAVLSIVGLGESVLVEAPVYGCGTALQTAAGTLCSTDSSGASSVTMKEILENWPTSKPKPKLFYTVPYGCNPSGVTTTLERRRDILALARKHNFLILEDDPYYYLYFGEAPRPPSYFELDAQDPNEPSGRVLRFDSFSKILSAGLRIGFLTGPTRLVNAVNLHTTAANLQSSSTTQVIASALLNHWGHDTFFEHTRRVSQFYRMKRDVFERAMNVHLKGLAEWSTPEAGMFFWFKLLLPSTPEAVEGDSEQLIRNKAVEAGVLTLPGASFFVSNKATPYVRTAFSLLDEADVNEALRRLATLLKGDSES